MESKVKLNGFQGAVVISFGLSICGSALNYVFQILMGNILTVEEFGIFNSINSLIANIVILFSPLSIIVCQVIAGRGNNRSKVIKASNFFAGRIVLSICIFGGLLFPSIKGKFGASTLVLWELLLLTIGLCGIFNILSGMLQGLEKFALLGGLGIVLTFLKAFFSIVGVSVQHDVKVLVFSFFLSYLLILAFTVVLIKKLYRKEMGTEIVGVVKQVDLKYIMGRYCTTIIAQLLFSFYINGGEILLMNMLFDEESIGYYSSAVTLGKVNLYIISVLSTVLFPTVARKISVGEDAFRVYKITVFFSVMVSILYGFFLVTIGKSLIPFFFGSKYEPALDYIWQAVIFTVPLGVLSIVNSYYLGLGKMREYSIILGVATIIQILVILLTDMEICFVPVMLGIGQVAIIAILTMYAYRIGRNEKVDC